MEAIVVPEHQLSENQLVRLTWKLQGLQSSVATILLCLLLYFMARTIGANPTIANIALGLGIPLVVLLLRYDSLPRQFRGPLMANAGKPRSYVFREEGFEVRGPDSLFEFVPWSYILFVRALPDFILLFVGPGQFYPIKKDVIGYEKSEELMKLITCYVSKVKIG